MRLMISITLGLALMMAVVWPLTSAQKLVIGKEPGVEVPEVTAGPGCKTCPRCQNNAHIADARVKYKVDGHPFNPHDLSGVWGNNGINLDAKTIPPMTPYGKQL